jgi:succinate-semialdehyde dehydrogenase
MESVDVVVATGGGAMVKSAYSSGKPSFGVGAGNVPVIIDRGVDLGDAVNKIVTGASFDNGIICSHEQFVLTPEERFAETVQHFTDTGKVWFTDDEAQIQKLREVVFPGGHLNKDVVGKSPRQVGAIAGIDVPESARIILLPAEGAGTKDLLAKEKLCPVVAILPYKTFRDAVDAAKANLLVEGAGHSAALHSNSEANIRNAGVELPISRLVVNQASSFTAGGCTARKTPSGRRGSSSRAEIRFRPRQSRSACKIHPPAHAPSLRRALPSRSTGTARIGRRARQTPRARGSP